MDTPAQNSPKLVPEPSPTTGEARASGSWFTTAPAVIVHALTPEQRERAFPGLSREAAVEAVRRDREAASADPGIEDQQAADARAWDTHLAAHRPVSSRIAKIVGAFAMLNTCGIPVLLAVLLGGGWLFEWAGWSTDWGYTVINVFLGALAAWIPVCAVWSVAAQISFRAVNRLLLDWVSRRDGQLARGVTTAPVPNSAAYLLVGGACGNFLALSALFAVVLTGGMLLTERSELATAPAEFWVFYAVVIAFAVVCGAVPLFTRRRLGDDTALAEALLPPNSNPQEPRKATA